MFGTPRAKVRADGGFAPHISVRRNGGRHLHGDDAGGLQFHRPHNATRLHQMPVAVAAGRSPPLNHISSVKPWMHPGDDTMQLPVAARRTRAIASGPWWCNRFAASQSLTTLAEPFRSNAAAFVEALRFAGAVVTTGVTRIPPERAYLMYWSWRIAAGKVEPASVPAKPGVVIDWTHGGNAEAAHTAAILMKHEYGMTAAPALRTRHTDGRAFDMTIQFGWALLIRDRKNIPWPVACQSDITPIGARYGLIKRIGDPHHWSDDGN
jgi:hypothetical protein